MNQKAKQKERPKSKEEYLTKRTPAYDKLCQNVRKLLSATCQTFVPDACDALRKDWVPTMTDETIRRDINKGLRDAIRERILETWSREINPREGHWTSENIRFHFPKWLKQEYPHDTAVQNMQKNQIQKQTAKILEKSRISDSEKQALQTLAENLPNRVIVKEADLYQGEGHGQSIEEDLEQHPLFRTDESGKKRLITVSGEIRKAATDLFKAITQKDQIAYGHQDLFVDHIRPARAQMKSFALEMQNAQPEILGMLYDQLRYTDAMLHEMISIIKVVMDEDEDQSSKRKREETN